MSDPDANWREHCDWLADGWDECRDEVARLAEADVCLHSTRVTLIEVAEHSDFEEGAEFGVRSCCHVRDYRPHAESCAVMRAISNIDAFLAREQNHE